MENFITNTFNKILNFVSGSDSKTTAVNTTTSNTLPLNGGKAEAEGNNDSFQKSSTNGLTSEEQAIYNKIYKKIEEICRNENIDINLAKSFNLLEKILDMTTKELIEASKTEAGKKEIDNTINTLINHLGFGDETGLGKKDTADLDIIVKGDQNKIAREKVGGSWLGQTWHKVKSFVGINTISKANTPDDIADRYKKAYLENIDKLSPEELKERYSDMLTEFYYDFNALSDNPEKQVAMTKAIALLAADHRDLIIEIMATQLKNNPKASEAFGKALHVNLNEITTTNDGLGNAVSKSQATKISKTSFSLMSEEDVKLALDTLKKDSTKFYEEYGEKIKELKARKDKGEVLSEAERKLLTEAENVYESQYAGAYTGIPSNNNISESNQVKLINQINNDTKEIGIQEEVFETVKDFIKENPDALGMSEEDFNEIINKATNNEYSELNQEDVNAGNPTVANTNSTTQNSDKISSENNTNCNTQSSVQESKENIRNSDINGGIGFTVKEPDNINTSTNTTSTITENQTAFEETEAEKEHEKTNYKNRNDLIDAVREGGVKAFYEVLSEGNETAIVADALNNKSLVGNDILNAAKNIYKSAKSTQINILERLSSTGIHIVDDLTTLETWNKASNKTFRSFEVTKLIHEKAEESIEEFQA